MLRIQKLFLQKIRRFTFYRKSAKPPRFQRNRQELAQISEYTSNGCCNKTRADMRIPDGLLLMWGVVPTF
jgi:hypothetical protein